MKKILRSTVIAATSVASIFSMPHGKTEAARHKKQRASTQPRGATTPPPDGTADPGSEDDSAPPKRTKEAVLALIADAEPAHIPPPAPAAAATPAPAETPQPAAAMDRYPWRREIVTTTFWIGERAAKNNPVPNRSSSWDTRWAAHYGGTDTPNRSDRTDFRPAAFVPGQNPFYVALPYNDMHAGTHKPEAKKIIPWFQDDYREPNRSVCKGRWVAIRFKGRTVYAQWEDAGPFRTDHHEYVFGKERPKKNLNKGAGLDVSPAVRDFLGMDDTDVTDWKFVDFDEVPHGPWTKYGDNNTFVINRRLDEKRLAALATREAKQRLAE